MAKRDPDQEKSFLSRWSQRKRDASAPAAETASASPAQREDKPAGEAGQASEVTEIDPDQLPDIESLDASSDFSDFMRPGVPEGLKQRALKKLWQVDPAFKPICMLDDYNLDYTDAAMVVPNLKTIYQIGKGMVLPEEEISEPAAEETAGAAGGEPSQGGGDALPEAAADRVAGPAGGERAGVAAEAAETAAERQPSGPAAVRRAPRNPGDPLVESVPVQRRPAPRVNRRSAQRRRWGDGSA